VRGVRLKMVERIPTGIPGLDKLIEGGFPRGDVILLAGGAGTGKTIFSSQFVYDGIINHKETATYVTLEEDAKTFNRNMLRFGWDFAKLEREDKLKILDLEALKGEGLHSIINHILTQSDQNHSSRLVIDSLTALFTACPEKFEARALLHVLYRMLKSRNCTTIITCSIPFGKSTLGFGVEEFVADSLMVLENVTEGLDLKTRIRVYKMRGTDHSRKYHRVLITDNGLEVLPFSE